mgnify:CR=1 FL=1
MKRLRPIFKVSLAKIFFVANYVICAVIFDWDKFFKYLETPARINCHLPPPSSGGHIEFCYGGASIFDLINILFGVIFCILTLPSIIITQTTLEMLKKTFPLWCLETYDIIYIPILAVINSFYWICLAHIIELSYSTYHENYSQRNKYIGIFRDF